MNKELYAVSDTRKSGGNKNSKTLKAALGTIGSNFDLLVPIIKKLIPELCSEDISKYIKLTVKTHNSFIRNLGIVKGTTHWSDIRNYCMLLCEGRPAQPVGFVGIGKTDKWPNCLGHLRPIYRQILSKEVPIEKKVEYYRFLHTLLKLNKVVSDLNALDTQSISNTFPVPPAIIAEFDKYLSLEVHPIKKVNKIRPFLSSSRGPNGQPMVESALREAWAIRHSSYWNSFRNLALRLDGEDFLSYLEQCSKWYEESPEFSPKVAKATLLRKLIAIGDSGNKSRTVAIGDFWTQNLLSCMESDVSQIISKRFSESSDFRSHSDGFNKITEWARNEEHRKAFLVSLDASAWTDNFPSILQRLVLERLYGKESGKAWYHVVVTCPWNLAKSADTVTYGKGQGMGIKGSFNIATLTDHLFIEMVLRKHYHSLPFYRKVGDDLVVEDRDLVLQDAYPSIGVPINNSKSKYSTDVGRFVEYVSRNSWNELDASVIPANLVSKARRSSLLLCPLITAINNRINSLDQRVYINDVIDVVKCSRNIREATIRTSTLYEYLTMETILSEGTILDSYPDKTEKDIILQVLTEVSKLFDKVLEKWQPAMREALIENHIRSKFDESEWIMFKERELKPSDLQLVSFIQKLDRQQAEERQVGERFAPIASETFCKELTNEENNTTIPKAFRLRISNLLFLLGNKLALNNVVGDLRSNIHAGTPQCEDFMKTLLQIDRRLRNGTSIESYDSVGFRSLRLSESVKLILADKHLTLDDEPSSDN